MRDTDPKQPTPTLGKKIEAPPMPKPHKRINGDVWKAPDGKFENRAPTPPGPTIWELYVGCI